MKEILNNNLTPDGYAGETGTGRSVIKTGNTGRWGLHLILAVNTALLLLASPVRAAMGWAQTVPIMPTCYIPPDDDRFVDETPLNTSYWIDLLEGLTTIEKAFIGEYVAPETLTEAGKRVHRDLTAISRQGLIAKEVYFFLMEYVASRYYTAACANPGEEDVTIFDKYNHIADPDKTDSTPELGSRLKIVEIMLLLAQYKTEGKSGGEEWVATYEELVGAIETYVPGPDRENASAMALDVINLAVVTAK